MADKYKKSMLVSLIGIIILLLLAGCTKSGGQTANVGTNNGNADIDGTSTADDETDGAEQAVDDVYDIGNEEKETGVKGAEEIFFEQDDLRLYFDPKLILDVQPISETIPAASGDSMYAPAHPAYIHYSLDMEQAQIYITSIEEYKTATDFAARIIADLHRLVKGIGILDGCVPELPLGTFYHVCEHQQFTANFQNVDFSNGSGVRFVTVYSSQDMVPVDNKHLMYVFQGFTDDGKYFVKMTVHLLNTQLSDIGEIPAEIYGATDYEIVKKYFAEFGTTLNESAEYFSPKLDWIDAFLASFRIE